MKKNRKVFYIFLLLLMLCPFCVKAISNSYNDKLAVILGKEIEEDKINFYFFRGEGCPHCKEEEKFIELLKDRYKERGEKAYCRKWRYAFCLRKSWTLVRKQ